ncbi:hypothetical protein QUA81_12040 [Microcoleus sp. F6_B4]
MEINVGDRAFDRGRNRVFYENAASWLLIQVKNPVSLVSMRPGLTQHISCDSLNLCDVKRGLSFKGDRISPMLY